MTVVAAAAKRNSSLAWNSASASTIRRRFKSVNEKVTAAPAL
ncbi:hypothetical protein [Methylorubrum aminovorans]